MEGKGMASDESWSSFGAAMSLEESEMMAQLLGTCPFTDEHNYNPGSAMASTMLWSDLAVDPCNRSYTSTDFSLSYCDSGLFVPHPYEYCDNYYMSESSTGVPVNHSSSCPPVDFYLSSEEQLANPSLQVVPRLQLDDHPSHNLVGDIPAMSLAKPAAVPHHESQPKRKIQYSSEDDDKLAAKESLDIQVRSPNKKPRASPSVIRRNSKSKKGAQKVVRSGDEIEESNAALNCATSGCYSSEDDSNASQELNGGDGGTSCSAEGTAALVSKEKTRATRGSATDPQSLYARKRRERINERLKILQNLVPNGTKVDISTMLEEAVQYVKFLQLQIKLLSSDDLWMYAPLAYNGMDIGLDLKIALPKQ